MINSIINGIKSALLLLIITEALGLILFVAGVINYSEINQVWPTVTALAGIWLMLLAEID